MPYFFSTLTLSLKCGVDASIIKSDGKDKVLFIKDKYYNYEDNLFTKFHNLKKKINSKKRFN